MSQFMLLYVQLGREFVSTVPENRRSQPKSTPGHSCLAFRLHQTLKWATEPRFYLNDRTFLHYLEPQVQYRVLYRNTKFAFQEIQAKVPGIPVLVYDPGRVNLISLLVSIYKMRIRIVSTSQGCLALNICTVKFKYQNYLACVHAPLLHQIRGSLRAGALFYFPSQTHHLACIHRQSRF